MALTSTRYYQPYYTLCQLSAYFNNDDLDLKETTSDIVPDVYLYNVLLLIHAKVQLSSFVIYGISLLKLLYIDYADWYVAKVDCFA